MRRGTSLHSSTRSSVVPLPGDRVRAVVASGRPGPHWYADASPFVVRGAIDRLVGGAGRRWPAPDRDLLEAGDRVGFWLVRRSTPEELLLEAQVRAPGTVELRTRMTERSTDPSRSGTVVEQTVTLTPSGWLGRAYLLADLPARETVVELAHRRLLADLSLTTG